MTLQDVEEVSQVRIVRHEKGSARNRTHPWFAGSCSRTHDNITILC